VRFNFRDYFCCISELYFSAAAASLGLAFAAGLAAALAGICSDARSSRVLTRLAAWDRLRVFLRALVFGMESSPPHSPVIEMVSLCLLTSYARIAKIAGLPKKMKDENRGAQASLLNQFL
jgi:hypothetical protein